MAQRSRPPILVVSGLLWSCKASSSAAVTIEPDGGCIVDLSPSMPSADRPLHPDASCPVTIDNPPLLPAEHVDIHCVVQWDSNPPSSGPHYSVWAAFQAYSFPVSRLYYVHDLEHGAIVFLYNCGDAGCPDIAQGLQTASDAIPDDPLCAADGEGVRVRTVITPDPLIDVRVAAAAWGWTYKADCLDLPTLTQFALDHYGKGPEVLCIQGDPNPLRAQ